MNERMKSDLRKLKEFILILLLSIWMLIPVLKNIELTNIIATGQEYTFIIFVGVVGLFFLILNAYSNFKEAESKEEYRKEILPIIILTIFMIWVLISCFFASDIMDAFLGNMYRLEGYFTYLGYAGFFSCALLIKSNKSKRILINLHVVAAVLNIVMIELYTRGIYADILAARAIKSSCFYQFNHFGYYLLLSSMSSIYLCITQKNKMIKLLNLITSVFLLYYLVLNDTFGCYLAIAITLVFFMIYCLFKKKKRIVSIAVIILFIIVSMLTPKTRKLVQRNINTFVKDIKNIFAITQIDDIKKGNVSNTNKNNNSNNSNITIKEEAEKKADKAGTGRFELWKNGIKIFLERPILGHGPDNLGEQYKEQGIYQDRPHNLLIYIATTSGIVGLVTYVTAIGIIWIRGLKRMRFDNDIHVISFWIVTAYLISAMFANSMYYISPYFFVFLGMLMGENIKQKNSRKQEVKK